VSFRSPVVVFTKDKMGWAGFKIFHIHGEVEAEAFESGVHEFHLCGVA